MLTYICDHGDQYLTNILIDLDGQQLTVRMKRTANSGQVVVSLPSEILDPVSELIMLSDDDSETLADIVGLIGRRMTGEPQMRTFQ